MRWDAWRWPFLFGCVLDGVGNGIDSKTRRLSPLPTSGGNSTLERQGNAFFRYIALTSEAPTGIELSSSSEIV